MKKLWLFYSSHDKFRDSIVEKKINIKKIVTKSWLKEFFSFCRLAMNLATFLFRGFLPQFTHEPHFSFCTFHDIFAV